MAFPEDLFEVSESKLLAIRGQMSLYRLEPRKPRINIYLLPSAPGN